MLERVRKEADGVLFVDAGDALTGPQVLAPQRTRRARLILDTYQALGLDGMATGELDRQAGVDLRRVRGGGIVTRAGIRVGVFAQDLEARPAPAAATLKAEAAALRRRGARLVVALLHGGASKPLPLLEQGDAGIDVAVVSHGAWGTTPIARAGSTWVVEVPAQGKQVGLLDLHVLDGKLEFVDVGARTRLETRLRDMTRESADLDARYQQMPGQLHDYYVRRSEQLRNDMAAAKRSLEEEEARPAVGASWLEDQQIQLAADIPDAPKVAQLLKRYKDDVGVLPAAPPPSTAGATAINSAGLAPVTGAVPGTGTTASTAGRYTGGQACRRCHETQYTFWQKTKHARAWKALLKDGQQRDPACVLCHVTGNLLSLPNVQCEACHGPGSAHAANPEAKGLIARNTSEGQCTVCHHAPQAREWEYTSFRAATVGKGHGGK